MLNAQCMSWRSKPSNIVASLQPGMYGKKVVRESEALKNRLDQKISSDPAEIIPPTLFRDVGFTRPKSGYSGNPLLALFSTIV